MQHKETTAPTDKSIPPPPDKIVKVTPTVTIISGALSIKRFKKIYEQVKEKMQLTLYIAWNSNNENLRNLFPKCNPSLEEFLVTIKDEVSQNDAH